MRGSELRDVDVLVPADPRLALDVQCDPLGKVAEAVTEASVHRVLEVRVRVHEAGNDHRVVVARAFTEISAVPTAAISPSSMTIAPASIGGPSTGRTQSAESTRFTASVTLAGSGRGARSFHQHREPDRRFVERDQRNALECRRDRIDAGKQHGDHSDDEVAEPPVVSQRVRRKDVETDECEQEDRNSKTRPTANNTVRTNE